MCLSACACMQRYINIYACMYVYMCVYMLCVYVIYLFVCTSVYLYNAVSHFLCKAIEKHLKAVIWFLVLHIFETFVAFQSIFVCDVCLSHFFLNMHASFYTWSRQNIIHTYQSVYIYIYIHIYIYIYMCVCVLRTLHLRSDDRHTLIKSLRIVSVS